jgi:hypothetical protein
MPNSGRCPTGYLCVVRRRLKRSCRLLTLDASSAGRKYHLTQPSQESLESGVSLSDHPGYLGRWSGSRLIVLIHADWPNYPAGEGPGFALAALGRFPADTDFTLIDDIDRCCLLIASQYKKYPDVFDDRNLHVAAWHEDLIELANSGYITGVQGVTETRVGSTKTRAHVG